MSSLLNKFWTLVGCFIYIPTLKWNSNVEIDINFISCKDLNGEWYVTYSKVKIEISYVSINIYG